ncbi:MAG: DMT family transporter [Opitutales bacterium]
MGPVVDAVGPIIYAGLVSVGIAYTLQIIAQQHVDPSRAAILLSLEAVFAVLGGWLMLDEILSGRELSGCILMFAGMLLSQLPGLKKKGASSRSGGERPEI